MKIAIEGLDKVMATLDGKAMVSGMLAGVAQDLEGQMRDAYPPAPIGQPAIWSSDPEKRKKQIRGFFARLKEGLIEVPYRRGGLNSQNLGKSWTTKKESETKYIIGNSTDYGPLVMDASRQTRFHKRSGWPTTQGLLAKNKSRIENIAIEMVKLFWKSKGTI